MRVGRGIGPGIAISSPVDESAPTGASSLAIANHTDQNHCPPSPYYVVPLDSHTLLFSFYYFNDYLNCICALPQIQSSKLVRIIPILIAFADCSQSVL